MSGQESLAERLAEHEWTRKSRCACRWTPSPCVFPEPYVSGADQYRAHVADALATFVREMQAQAWDEGRSFGAHDRQMYEVGDGCGPDSWDCDCPNPYRDDESEGR